MMNLDDVGGLIDNDRNDMASVYTWPNFIEESFNIIRVPMLIPEMVDVPPVFSLSDLYHYVNPRVGFVDL